MLSRYIVLDVDTVTNKCIITTKHTLPQPLVDFGYILINKILMIFGGETSNMSTIDDIYRVDIATNSSIWKWQKCSVKTPSKAQFHAVLLNETDIHLFDKYDGSHFVINIETLSQAKVL